MYPTCGQALVNSSWPKENGRGDLFVRRADASRWRASEPRPEPLMKAIPNAIQRALIKSGYGNSLANRRPFIASEMAQRQLSHAEP